MHRWQEITYYGGSGSSLEGFNCSGCGKWANQEGFEAYNFNPHLFTKEQGAALEQYRKFVKENTPKI